MIEATHVMLALIRLRAPTTGGAKTHVFETAEELQAWAARTLTSEEAADVGAFLSGR